MVVALVGEVNNDVRFTVRYHFLHHSLRVLLSFRPE